MDILQELADAGAVYQDHHFVYVSGKHGPGYINPDMIFPDLHLLTGLCRGLGKPYRDDEVHVVVGPATGGIALAVLTALSLSNSNAVLAPAAIWADKSGDDFVFERAGFASHLANSRVLVVEDLLTTGGSVAKVCGEAERHGAEIIGVSVICNRGGVTAGQLGVPRLEALTEVSFEAVSETECELCQQGVPIVEDIGHGGEYKLAHPGYEGGYIKLLS